MESGLGPHTTESNKIAENVQNVNYKMWKKSSGQQNSRAPLVGQFFTMELKIFRLVLETSEERHHGPLTIVVAPPILSLKHYIPVGKPNSRNDFKLEIKYNICTHIIKI